MAATLAEILGIPALRAAVERIYGRKLNIMTESEWLSSEDPQAMVEFLLNGPATPKGYLRKDWQKPSERKLRLLAVACCRQLLIDDGGGCILDVVERFADGKATEEEYVQAIEHSMDWPNKPVSSLARVLRAVRDKGHLSGVLKNCLTMKGAVPADQANLLRDIFGNPFRPVTLPTHPDVTKWETAANKPLPAGIAAMPTMKMYTEKIKEAKTKSCPWLTPTVLSLAQAAYDERPGRKCDRCQLEREAGLEDDGGSTCPTCHGTGTISDGTLDPARLAILSDALEEAGCVGEMCPACPTLAAREAARVPPDARWPPTLPTYWCGRCDEQTRLLPSPILAHLRSPGTHVRGCWVLDLILGME